MDRADRQNRIIEYLKIKPLSHGQVETCLVDLPPAWSARPSIARHHHLCQSLADRGSNLIPLVVRRREEGDGGEVLYETVYGEDWLLAAREVGIDRLWVWVFDLDDTAAAAVRSEAMALAAGELAGSGLASGESEDSDSPVRNPAPPLERSLGQGGSLSLEAFDRLLQRRLGEALPPDRSAANEQRPESALASRLDRLEAKLDRLAEFPPPPIVPSPELGLDRLSGAIEQLATALASSQGRVKLELTLGEASSSPAGGGTAGRSRPTSKLTKVELEQELRQRNISFPAKATKPQLIALLQDG